MPTNQKKRKRNFVQAGILLAVVLLATAAVAWYGNQRFMAQRLPLHFVTEDGTMTETVYAEIASTPSERRNGLMFRKPGDLAENEGMLFIFPKEEYQSFWMKNTYISLDMIFMDQTMEVVSILRDRPILTTESQATDHKSKYVLEVLAGRAEALGIEPGMKMKLLGPIPDPL